MQTNLADKFYGVLFGLAVGDALGFATEFLSRAQVRFAYPQGLTDYSQIHFYSYITQCLKWYLILIFCAIHSKLLCNIGKIESGILRQMAV